MDGRSCMTLENWIVVVGVVPRESRFLDGCLGEGLEESWMVVDGMALMGLIPTRGRV